jgi:hypothetical protein
MVPPAHQKTVLSSHGPAQRIVLDYRQKMAKVPGLGNLLSHAVDSWMARLVGHLEWLEDATKQYGPLAADAHGAHFL